MQAVSDCVATTAEIKSYDKTYASPFEAEARASDRKKWKNHRGGKRDDITAIVSQVRSLI